MKRLILINGTMGVGKTATSKRLQTLLPNSVFLDGDWCWDASPFIVNDETKAMVLRNIAYLLTSFLTCSVYENVILCWVMHERRIIDAILAQLPQAGYALHIFTLVCTEEALVRRIDADIARGVRMPQDTRRCVERLPLYALMDTRKVDVSDIDAAQAAERIKALLLRPAP